MIIISRFIEEEDMINYINKFMKISLGLFYATEKKRILKMGTVFGKVVKDEQ